MRYYHTTNAAEPILVAGFRDNSGGQDAPPLVVLAIEVVWQVHFEYRVLAKQEVASVRDRFL